jgi:hypothetical protein
VRKKLYVEHFYPFQPLTYITQYKERYFQLNKGVSMKVLTQTKKNKGINALLRELSDDEEAVDNTGPDIPEDPNRPWLRGFRTYMDSLEQVPDGWTSIRWWGVSNLNILRIVD